WPLSPHRARGGVSAPVGGARRHPRQPDPGRRPARRQPQHAAQEDPRPRHPGGADEPVGWVEPKAKPIAPSARPSARLISFRRMCIAGPGDDPEDWRGHAMDDLSVLKQTLASWSLVEISAAAVVFAGVVLVALTQFETLGRWLGLDRFPRWHSAVGGLGTLLVILGLAGEIIAATKARVISDRISVQLTQQTAAAIERSKAMEKDAAELRLQLARLKWRVITPEQQATLMEFLKAAPKGPVLILYALDDEPRSYATPI